MTFTNRTFAVALAAAFTLGACGGAADDAGSAAGDAEMPDAEAGGEMPDGHGGMSGTTTALTYECADDRSFTLILLDGAARAQVELDGEMHDLEPAPSDSAMGYVGGEIEFVGRGTAATLSAGGEIIFADCEAVGHAAQ